MQGALQTQLSFPKGQARSEGLSKVCCIGCQLQAPLFRQGQENTARGQAPLTQAQAPTSVPVPITGGHSVARSCGCQGWAATRTWGVEEWLLRAFWTALWATLFLSLDNSLLLLPRLPWPRYKEEKVAHHSSSARIKSSSTAVTHPMTVRPEGGSG